MEIASEEAHRALSYVSAVSRQGHSLTAEELRAYMRSPDRLVTPGKGLQSILVAAGQAFGGGGTSEDRLHWLTRLKWLELDDKETVRTTPLGEAVLRGLEERAAEPESPVLTILGSQDSLAYAQVIGAIAGRGKGLLVDPYFRLESLTHVLSYTALTRLLTGPHAELAGLATAFDTIALDRSFEVRVSDEPHDRFVVPASGPVDQLGTSLSGVGNRFAVMTTIQPPAADALRDACEIMWTKAAPLNEAAQAGSKPGASGRRRAAKSADKA
jgi:hypothetical protein